jgi:hypothetical protein
VVRNQYSDGIEEVTQEKKWPVRLTAKQAPHRPDTAPAHGLRAENGCPFMIPQTGSVSEEG